MQDTYYNPGNPLSRAGIPTAAFHYRSDAYDALLPAQQATVRQYMPWSPEYAGLNPAQQETVNARNRTNHEINANRLTKLTRKLTFRQRPNYQPFDPNSRDSIRITTGQEATVEATWTRDRIINTFQNQLTEIRNPPAPGAFDYARLREWFNEPIPAAAAAMTNEDIVRRAVFNLGFNFTKASLQMRISATKMDAITDLCIKQIRKHIREMLMTGEVKGSAFKNWAEAFFGKMISATGFANEPYVGRGPITGTAW